MYESCKVYCSLRCMHEIFQGRVVSWDGVPTSSINNDDQHIKRFGKASYSSTTRVAAAAWLRFRYTTHMEVVAKWPGKREHSSSSHCFRFWQMPKHLLWDSSADLWLWHTHNHRILDWSLGQIIGKTRHTDTHKIASNLHFHVMRDQSFLQKENFFLFVTHSC